MCNFARTGSLCLLIACISLASRLSAQVFFLRDTFCSNQLLVVNNHLYGPDNPTGTEVLPGAAANGMDSIIEVRLVFLQPALLQVKQTLCKGDTLWVNNVPYHAGFSFGEEVIEGGAANGCDSIIEVNLTFLDKGMLKIDQILCEGDTLWVNGKVYDAFHPAGVELISAGSQSGCDSTIEVNLHVQPLPYSELTDTLCPDSFLVINGNRYDRNNRSGLERLSHASVSGCDSLVNIRLSFRDLWISLGDDLELSAGDSACLSPLFSFQPVDLEWSPALPCTDVDCLPVCQPYFSNQQYTLTATDVSGCRLSDDIRIKVSRKPPWYAPNVFKPDAPSPNNRFFISTGPGIQKINHLWIVDRWGEIIFERENMEADNPADGWDGLWKGKLCPPGVYIFWAETQWRDGTIDLVSGSFTLLQ